MRPLCCGTMEFLRTVHHNFIFLFILETLLFSWISETNVKSFSCVHTRSSGVKDHLVALSEKDFDNNITNTYSKYPHRKSGYINGANAISESEDVISRHQISPITNFTIGGDDSVKSITQTPARLKYSSRHQAPSISGSSIGSDDSANTIPTSALSEYFSRHQVSSTPASTISDELPQTGGDPGQSYRTMERTGRETRDVGHLVTSGSHSSSYTKEFVSPDNPLVKIIATVTRRSRRARRQIQRDFTQVNQNVCPPSLCIMSSEGSTRSRPRGTGGTVFFQGDIVLDQDLDSIIYGIEKLPDPSSIRGRGRQRRGGGDKEAKRERRRKRRQRRQERKERNKRTKEGGGSKKKENVSTMKFNITDSKSRSIIDLKQEISTSLLGIKRKRRSVESYVGVAGRGSEVSVMADGWLTEERSGRSRRATMRRRKRLWKKGVVVYKWARNINELAKKTIQRAMKHITDRTCVTFKEKTSDDKDFVKFISEPGCWSQIGKVGGSQMVSLGKGCESVGTAVHEIVHALGVWHEQARPDRDKFVKVLEENISDRFLPDFEKVSSRLSTARGYTYDYQSLMHYSPYAFTRNGEQTMQVIGLGRRLKLRIGQRRGLSTIDISQLRDMYKCNQRTDAEETVCQKGWVKNYLSCYKFVTSSPEHFGAAFEACKKENSNLVIIEGSREQKFIEKFLGRKFPRVNRWRTAGKNVNGTMVWFKGEKSVKNITSYTNWARGHPGSRTSLVLTRDPRSGKVTWQGEHEGDARYRNYYRHPYICEKQSRRKCLQLHHADGRDYRGDLDHTREGYTCQRWTENYPHNHTFAIPTRAAVARAKASNTVRGGGDADSDGLGNHNKCRNPAGLRRNRPWCYTSKRRHEWGYCDVQACGGFLRQIRSGRRGGERSLVPSSGRGGTSTGQHGAGSSRVGRTGSGTRTIGPEGPRGGTSTSSSGSRQSGTSSGTSGSGARRSGTSTSSSGARRSGTSSSTSSSGARRSGTSSRTSSSAARRSGTSTSSSGTRRSGTSSRTSSSGAPGLSGSRTRYVITSSGRYGPSSRASSSGASRGGTRTHYRVTNSGRSRTSHWHTGSTRRHSSTNVRPGYTVTNTRLSSSSRTTGR